ncbi:MAG: glycosyltransferase [Barnesiella sp.]|nr:glycosyltransferase [Barnesiella sp.]
MALFTIITPTFNAQATLPPTLRSIEEQKCDDYELIVMDGGSKDSTIEMARRAHIPSERLTIVSERDRGLYDAMNKAMRLAHGEYLVFLNAGDTFHSPDTLSTIAHAIRESGADIVYGQTQLVDADRRRIADRHLTAPEHLDFKSFAQGMLVCHQAFIVRRTLAEEYDMSYRLSADYEWCIRCLRKSKLNRLIDTTLIDYLYEGLSTQNRRKSLMERFRIMCRYYGTVPTIVRHLGFIPRFLRHKAAMKQATHHT